MTEENMTIKKKEMYDTIDNILNQTPSEMKKVVENLEFIEDVSQNNIPKGEVIVKPFGVETFDLHDALKDNIWDRSIFTVDAIVNTCIETSIERMKKYIPKKTKKGFEYWWLIILIIIFGVGIILIIIFLIPLIKDVKFF